MIQHASAGLSPPRLPSSGGSSVSVWGVVSREKKVLTRFQRYSFSFTAYCDQMDLYRTGQTRVTTLPAPLGTLTRDGTINYAHQYLWPRLLSLPSMLEQFWSLSYELFRRIRATVIVVHQVSWWQPVKSGFGLMITGNPRQITAVSLLSDPFKSRCRRTNWPGLCCSVSE